jgi:sec-independent protein translocase protein TatA
MGAFQPWHWILVILVVVVLFGGKGKLSGLMGDAAKGIKAFREGLKDDDKKNETPVEKVTDEVTKV